MKFVILAGGGGTRLWPVSRKNSPKQVKPFIGDRTMLQTTFDRLASAFPVEDIYISTNIAQKNDVVTQLPSLHSENLILEPLKRDTAPAIGLAAVHLMQKEPNSNFVTINSDAHVEDNAEYIRILKLADKLINENPKKCVMVGVNPTYPETGYGYIKMKKSYGEFAHAEGSDTVFEVEKFVEKPDFETAEKYVSSWEYLWNPALFIWNTQNLMSQFKEFLPKHFEILQDINNDYLNKTAVQEKFTKMDPISIDYGIMEKLDDMLVVPADFGWADIGHWRTVKDVLSKEDENLVKGSYIGEDSKGNLIYNYTDNIICTIGLENMIIVQTSDVLLVCPKDRSQDVKKIVSQLKDQGKHHLL